MKLLLTGDFHLDAVTAGQPRMAEVREAFSQITARVRAERIDAVLFLGDLCNPDRGSRTLRSVTLGVEMFHGLVRQAGCAVVLVAGNHDVVHDGSGLTSLSPIRAAFGCGPAGLESPQVAPGTAGAPGPDNPRAAAAGPARGAPGAGVPPIPAVQIPPGVLYVAERPTYVSLTGEDRPVHVLALPFVAAVEPYDPPSTVEAVARWREYWSVDAPMVVAGHLSIEGAQLGSETTDMARGRDVSFPVRAAERAGAALLCNGHYHKRQTVRGIECPGSLVRLAFDESDNEPRWLEVEL